MYLAFVFGGMKLCTNELPFCDQNLARKNFLWPMLLAWKLVELVIGIMCFYLFRVQFLNYKFVPIA